MHDPQNIKKLSQGDGSALRRLHKAMYGKLYALAYRLTASESMANDVITDVFKRLWKNRKELNVYQQVPPILIRDTYVQAMTLSKGTSSAKVDVKWDLPPDSSLSKMSELMGRMENLPRLVYLLHSSDGYSYREISQALDVSEETVVHYHAKALSVLQELLT